MEGVRAALGIGALLFLASCASSPKREPARGGFFQALEKKSNGDVDRSPAGFHLDSALISRLGLRWPVSQAVITSKFGKRDDGFHDGVDLRARVGTPVYAPAAGIVIYAGKEIRGYGRMVVLQHRGKIATVSAHHSKILVHRGQRVSKGQLIAYSGDTGQTTGPHVHFEVRYAAAPIDPVKMVRTR